MKWIVAAVAALVAAAVIAIGVYPVSVEEPGFKSVLKDKAYELRDYPALVVAETTAQGSQKQAAAEGFRRLANYIFGGNKGDRKIAMTAPVAQVPTGEKIAMTAPVAQTGAGDEWVVRFTMPKGYTLQTLPQPNNPAVRLRETPPTRYAVIRFSGLAQPGDVANKTAALFEWIKQHDLHPTGPATLAQYNPPWTFWFLRRNEVMIAIES